MSDLRMPDINHAQIAGRLTRDAELRNVSTGSTIASFSVAVEKRFKDKSSGETKSQTAFIAVQLWNPGDWILGQLTKGRAVIVDGELVQEEWEDKDTGKKRSRTKINARRVQMLDWAKNDQESSRTPQNPSPVNEDDIPF